MERYTSLKVVPLIKKFDFFWDVHQRYFQSFDVYSRKSVFFDHCLTETEYIEPKLSFDACVYIGNTRDINFKRRRRLLRKLTKTDRKTYKHNLFV